MTRNRWPGGRRNKEPGRCVDVGLVNMRATRALLHGGLAWFRRGFIHLFSFIHPSAVASWGMTVMYR